MFPFRAFASAALFLSVVLGSAGLQGAPDAAAAAWQRHQSLANAAGRTAQQTEVELSPVDRDLPTLEWADVFEPLVGDYGLTYSARVMSLNGRRVRIRGYMVREPVRHRGVFMLTRIPVQVQSDGYCFVEDLPPATVHVLMSGADAERPAAYVPGLLSVAGTLEIGTGETPDARNSRIRLRLDAPPPSDRAPPTRGESAVETGSR